MSYRGVGPGIDISHYGAPYKGMLGLGEMLYRYHGMGVVPWTGAPAEDPRMVKRYTVVRATWNVQNLPSGGARDAASRILYQGRQAFPGDTVRKIGSTGWISGGRVGYEVVLANTTRAGEIKAKNFRAGSRAQTGMGGNVRFTAGRTAIPANGFTESGSDAPSTPEVSDIAAPSFMTRRVAGLPTWGWGLIGVGAIGAVVAATTMGGRPRRAPAAPTPNRRRRRRRSRR